MTSCSRRPARWRWTRAAAGLAASAVALSLLAAGCGTPQRAASPAPTPAPSQSTPAPPARRTTPTAATPAGAVPGRTATSAAGPVFQASTSVLTAAMRARMTGVSWHQGCPVSLASLRLLRLSYWGFDHTAHEGELVVNASAAADVTHAFGLLFAAGFPVRQMRVVDDFGGDDQRSMLADNTSAFNCRLVPGTNVWSQHAYGLAVDVNPFENPEVQGSSIDPPAAAAWADRSRSSSRTGIPPGVRSTPSAGPGRGLAVAQGLHALLRQRPVNQCLSPQPERWGDVRHAVTACRCGPRLPLARAPGLRRHHSDQQPRHRGRGRRRRHDRGYIGRGPAASGSDSPSRSTPPTGSPASSSADSPSGNFLPATCVALPGRAVAPGGVGRRTLCGPSRRRDG